MHSEDKPVENSIRPALSGRRNGLPEPGGYVYRGGKEPGGWDVMPWAITDDDSMDYDRGALDVPSMSWSAVSKRKRRAREKRAACDGCGYMTGSPNCKLLCA